MLIKCVMYVGMTVWIVQIDDWNC